jgi:hypothetical protein
MNLMINTKTFRLTTAAGLLLGTALAASAAGNSIITFSVDMTGPIQTSAFTPGTSHVFVRGMFNDWSTGANYDHSGSSQLTNNPAAVNPNIYSGTFADTNDANGSVTQYKYYIDTGDNWEGVNNRTWGLPTASGGSLVLPTYYFNDTAPTGLTPVTNSVTFQVDLTQQIALGNFTPGTSHVFARGSFNNWGNDNTATSPFPLTNNPAAPNTNLYTGEFLGPTYTEGGEIDNPGAPQHFKYYIDNAPVPYESPSPQSIDGTGNRVYNLLQANGALVLPAVYFNDLPPVPPVTNVITFQVDMSMQAALGRFNPPPGGSDYVEARGSFNNWAGGFTLTNFPPPYTNKYGGEWTVINNPGSVVSYKFWDTTFPGGYETPSSTGGNNRTVNLLNANGPIVIPDVYFSDQTTNSIVSANTMVTFSVDMTGAILYGTTTPFDPNTQSVYINGDWLGWWTWRPTPDNLGPAPYQLTHDPVGPNPNLYSVTLQVPAANALGLTYKYAIGGADNEAGFGQNHVRYVRTIGNYTNATDKFGTMYAEPAWPRLLSIGAPSGGHALVSWLGLPGVQLQTKANLTSGSWVNLPETDGTSWSSGYIGTNGFVSTTNYPTSGQTYLRLIQPEAAPPAP